MISEHLDNWKNENNMFGCEIDERIFRVFFDDMLEKGSTLRDIVSMLAYAMYEQEICMEGLIEDVESING